MPEDFLNKEGAFQLQQEQYNLDHVIADDGFCYSKKE